MNNDPNIQRQIQVGQSFNLALGVKGKLRFWHNREKYLDDLASLAMGIFGRLHRQGNEVNAKAERVKQMPQLTPEDRDARAREYISKMVAGADTEEKWEKIRTELFPAAWMTQKDKDFFTGLRLSWEAKQRNAANNQ